MANTQKVQLCMFLFYQTLLGAHCVLRCKNALIYLLGVMYHKLKKNAYRAFLPHTWGKTPPAEGQNAPGGLLPQHGGVLPHLYVKTGNMEYSL